MVNKKKQLIFRLILFVIISAILGVGIYTMNAKMLMNDMMPMPLGVGMGVVVSGSMEPELSIDDVIFVVKDKDIELMAKCNAGEITREECEAQLSRKY